ncbi:MAG: hypothetical protein V3T23_01880 [Nitrososphaerales archaeon]
MKHLWEVDHPYYCETNNWYSNEAHLRYDCWTDFIEDWGELDLDMNHVFRWDWDKERHCLQIFMMLQRKGWFRPIEIFGMIPEDEDSVKEWLSKHWQTILKLWEPLT